MRTKTTFRAGLFSLGTALAVLTAPAQDTPAPAPGAGAAEAKPKTGKIQFAHTSFDFGRVNPTDQLKHDFIFTNIGSATLEITDVHPGCGCTTAGAWERKVEPGKTGLIPIQFSPANFSGTVSKSISVTCTNPAQPSLALHIQATVWRPVELTPNSAYFMVVEDMQTNETRIIRVINNEDTPLELSELQSTNQQFKAELKTIRPGKEFELHVSMVPPLNAQNARGTITLRTSSTNSPLLSLTTFAMLQPAVTVMPGQILLRGGPQSNSAPYMVTIRAFGTNSVSVTEPVINVEGATVKMQEIDRGRVFNVQVSFPNGFELGSGQKAELTLKSTHPKYSVLKVPVMQFPAPAFARPLPAPSASTAPPGSPR